jgi:exopolysaccharide production protein ExoQ
LRTTRAVDADPIEVLAQAVLVVAPLMAFRAIPGLANYTLAMVLPGAVLFAALLRRPGLRFPTWELLLIGLLAVSVLWGDDPAYSVERLRTYLPLVLATVAAGALLDSRRVLRCAEILVVVILVSSILFILADPAARHRIASGAFYVRGQFFKNTYGALLCFSMAVLLARRRRINPFVFVVLVVLVAGNRSVTAWGVCLIVIVLAVLARWIFARLGARAGRPVFLLVTAAVVGIGGLVLEFASDAAFRVVDKSPELTGRTQIWAACLVQIRKSPLLGHGAFTFLDSASGSPVTQAVWAQFTDYKPPHPHNGLLDLWGQLGLVGVAVFAGLLLTALVRAFLGASRGSAPSVAAFLGLVFVLVFSLTEPTFLGSYLLLTIILSAMAAPGLVDDEDDPPGAKGGVSAPAPHRQPAVSAP